MKKIISDLSIKYKTFAATFAMMLFFVLLFALFQFRGIKNNRINISLSNLHTLAVSVKNESELAGKNIRNVASSAALLPEVTEHAGKRNMKALEKNLLKISSRLSVRNMFFVSADGRTFISTGKMSMRRKYPSAGDISISNVDKELVVYGVAPVYYRNNLTGYITAETGLSELFGNFFKRFGNISWEIVRSEYGLSEDEKTILKEARNKNIRKHKIVEEGDKFLIYMYLPFTRTVNKKWYHLFTLKYLMETEIRPEERRAAISSIIQTTLLSALASFFLSLLLTRYFIRQIEKIKHQAEAVIKGDFVSHQYNSRDEFGQMGALIDTMVKKVHTSLVDLKESKTELQSIFSHIADGILVTDGSGAVITLNISLIGLLDLAGKKTDNAGQIYEILRAKIKDKNSSEILRKAFEEQDFAEGEVSLTTGEKTTDRVLTYTATPLLNKEGQFSGKVFSFHDSSAERELDRMKSDFVANVAHELRTPLTVIKGFVDLLSNEKYSKKIKKAEKAEYHDLIKTNITRLTKMINDLLDLSKMEAREMNMSFARTNLFPVVRAIYKSFAGMCADKGVELLLNVPENIPEAMADNDRISQVFYNLVYNAIKFTDRGGRIIMSCDGIELAGAKYIRFSVQDSGKGIEKENLELIFDKFKQVGRQKEGTGLGLAIAKSIVELHHGRIWAESPPPGQEKGTAINFILPIDNEGRVERIK